MTLITSSDIATSPGDHLLLEEASWDLYDLLVRETPQRILRITYDQGRLELMSPLPKHERVKKLIGSMVAIISLERGIAMAQFGSTTFRRRVLEKGIEPDECYYIQNEAKVRGKMDFDFEIDPPPDLALEVDVTNWSIDRLPIYAALGVKEIWRHDGKRLGCLHLIGDDNYQPAAMSLALPFLKVADLNRFLEMRSSTEETTLLLSFRDWVREGL